MFSLLPEEYRKKLHTEYRIRLTLIGLFGLFVLAVISGVFIFPTYIRVSTENKISQMQKDALEKQVAIETGINSSDDLKNIKQNMNVATLDQRSFVGAVNAVTEVQKKGIRINSFAYTYNLKGSTLVVGGIASSRQVLQTFHNDLLGQKIFVSADLPLSDYANDSDIVFSITLTGLF